MPATISIKSIGLPSVEKDVRASAEGFYRKFPENWTVSILGEQTNDAWKVRVKAPDGRESVRMLHGHDGGGHRTERVLETLEQLTAELHSTKS